MALGGFPPGPLFAQGFFATLPSIVPPLKNGEFGDSFVEYALLLGNVKSAILLKRKLSSEASEQSFAFSPPFT